MSYPTKAIAPVMLEDYHKVGHGVLRCAVMFCAVGRVAGASGCAACLPALGSLCAWGV